MSLFRNISRSLNISRISLNSGLRSYSVNATKLETPGETLPPSPKVSSLVDEISKLTLLETADLISALKIKLNISEIAMPVSAAAAGAPAAAAPSQAAAAEEKPAEKTIFTVKLEKFDAASKAKVIREIKGILTNATLVEAKKFVESAPKVIKTDVPKEEAEKLKKALEAAGATIVLE